MSTPSPRKNFAIFLQRNGLRTTIPSMQPREWDLYVKDLGPRLFRYFRYRGVRDQAADLTQETFIRLLKAFDGFDEAKGSLTAFTMGIARNVWLEHRRGDKSFDSLEDHPGLLAPMDIHENLANLDQAEKLRILLERLPELQQDILYLYFDEELTTREIGEVLKIPEGTIKSHLHRSKEFLKEILSKETP